MRSASTRSNRQTASFLTDTGPGGSANNGEASHQWPIAATQQVAAGNYTVTITTSTQAQVTVFIKRGNANDRQLLDVKFWKVTTSAEVGAPAAEAALEQVWRQRADQIFGPHDLGIGTFEFIEAPAGVINTFANLPLPTNQNPPDQSHRDVCRQFNALTGDQRALHFVLVDTIVDPDDPGGETLGNAAGIPGAPIESDWVSSCVIASGLGSNTFAANATTAWHEAGHLLGLQHTTESEGTAFDFIADTPQCDAGTFDGDMDGTVTAAECAAADGTNFMFHDGDGTVSSPGQGFLLKRHPLFRPASDLYNSLTVPCQVLNSGVLNGGQAQTFQVTGPTITNLAGTACGIPSYASGVMINMRAVNPLRGGNLRLAPTGQSPLGGIVNFNAQPNQFDNSNTVSVPLSGAGQLTVSVNAGPGGVGLPTTGVRGLVLGWYGPQGLEFFPLAPCVVADSRPNLNPGGTFAGPLAAGTTNSYDFADPISVDQGGGNTTCGVPTTADAVFVNMVTITPSGAVSLTADFGGTTASLMQTNVTAPVMNNSNAMTLPLSATGTVAIGVAGTNGLNAHVRLIVSGYYDDTQGTGLRFAPVLPCAAFDSRTNAPFNAQPPFAGPRLGDTGQTYQITGTFPAGQGGGQTNCGVPTGAPAVEINIVAVNVIRGGNLRAFATGTPGTGGVVNFANLAAAMNNSNSVIVPLSAVGQMDIFTNVFAADANLPSAQTRGVVLGYFSAGIAPPP